MVVTAGAGHDYRALVSLLARLASSSCRTSLTLIRWAAARDATSQGFDLLLTGAADPSSTNRSVFDLRYLLLLLEVRQVSVEVAGGLVGDFKRLDCTFLALSGGRRGCIGAGHR